MDHYCYNHHYCYYSDTSYVQLFKKLLYCFKDIKCCNTKTALAVSWRYRLTWKGSPSPYTYLKLAFWTGKENAMKWNLKTKLNSETKAVKNGQKGPQNQPSKIKWPTLLSSSSWQYEVQYCGETAGKS